MEDSFEITANNFTGSTKVQANHPIPNIMANGVEEHSYLEFNRRMYGVLQQLAVPKELAKTKKGSFSHPKHVQTSCVILPYFII
jgi:hypothetical protein